MTKLSKKLGIKTETVKATPCDLDSANFSPTGKTDEEDLVEMLENYKKGERLHARFNAMRQTERDIPMTENNKGGLTTKQAADELSKFGKTTDRVFRKMWGIPPDLNQNHEIEDIPMTENNNKELFASLLMIIFFIAFAAFAFLVVTTMFGCSTENYDTDIHYDTDAGEVEDAVTCADLCCMYMVTNRIECWPEIDLQPEDARLNECAIGVDTQDDPCLLYMQLQVADCDEVVDVYNSAVKAGRVE